MPLGAARWRYAGVRPLYDDGSSDPSAVTRDYTLRLDAAADEAPVLSVFGGKITTYRRLAEHALEKLAPYFPRLPGAWTGRTPLPGSDFKDREEARKELLARHRDLPPEVLQGVFRRHGARALQVLGDGQLGEHFGAGLTERELRLLLFLCRRAAAKALPGRCRDAARKTCSPGRHRAARPRRRSGLRARCGPELPRDRPRHRLLRGRSAAAARGGGAHRVADARGGPQREDQLDSRQRLVRRLRQAGDEPSAFHRTLWNGSRRVQARNRIRGRLAERRADVRLFQPFRRRGQRAAFQGSARG